MTIQRSFLTIPSALNDRLLRETAATGLSKQAYVSALLELALSHPPAERSREALLPLLPATERYPTQSAAREAHRSRQRAAAYRAQFLLGRSDLLSNQKALASWAEHPTYAPSPEQIARIKHERATLDALDHAPTTAPVDPPAAKPALSLGRFKFPTSA